MQLYACGCRNLQKRDAVFKLQNQFLHPATSVYSQVHCRRKVHVCSGDSVFEAANVQFDLSLQLQLSKILAVVESKESTCTLTKILALRLLWRVRRALVSSALSRN